MRWKANTDGLGENVPALDDMIEEELERAPAMAAARTGAGLEAGALDRAMQCAIDAARKYGAYADGPLRWLEPDKRGKSGT